MNILAIESSALAAGAAVVTDSLVVSEQMTQNKLTHSQTLMPMVDAAIQGAGLTLSDIDLFACTIGPGSFTGLRIGVTTAKTLAYATGKKVVGINTLETLAFGIGPTPYMICPVLDARRDRVYRAMYRCENGAVTQMLPPEAEEIQTLTERLSQPTVFVGDAASIFEGKQHAIIAPPHLCMSRAAATAVLAKGKTPIEPQMLNPIYLQLSQAERELIQKERKEDIK